MSVTFVIACPECKKKFKGRPELQGKKIKCPACSHPFTVQTISSDGTAPAAEAAPRTQPAAEAIKPAPVATPAVKPKGAASWEEEDNDANPYGVTSLDLAPRCPFCANELESADAIICLFCGYNTQTRQIGGTKKTVETYSSEQFMWLLPGLLCVAGMLVLVLLYLFFCFGFPGMVRETWMAIFDHESMRLWASLICLGGMWAAGLFAYKRLIVEPTPPEKVKD
jgi:hypothetical protein